MEHARMEREQEDGPGSGDHALTEPSPHLALVFERRWLPAGAGLRSLPCTNVPHVVGAAATPFDWGNHSPGAYELALNVLELTLEHLRHRGPRIDADGRVCFLAARLLQRPLVAEMIADVPEEGATVPMAVMERWVACRMDKMDNTGRSVIVPRYRLLHAAPGVWSAEEAEAILGEPLNPTSDGLRDSAARLVATPVHPHPLDAAAWELPPL
jgi:hypothetical protein